MKRLLIALVVAVIIALGVVLAVQWIPTTQSFYTDADTIKQPITTARIRDILWQPPTRLEDIINSAGEDYEPRVSGDGLTLFFVRGKAGQNADIFVAHRKRGGWSEPEPLSDVNSDGDDLGPAPSADGQTLYFYSNRDGTFGGYDLWVSYRDGDRWRPAANLGPLVNSQFNDYGPALTSDGTRLYFSSNRPLPTDAEKPNPDAWPATLREDFFHRTYDLYTASISDRGMGQAIALTALNTVYNEGAPAVSPWTDFLYFASDRPGGEGGFDLYRTRRLAGGFEPAMNLGDVVNSTANELDPALSLGGYALHFSSDRLVASDDPSKASDAHGEVASSGDYNLYRTTSREVFARAEALDRPAIDWAALWAQVGPNLLWALLLLFLLLLMFALFKSMQSRKMGLLARCMLASIAAHLLLLMLFNVWEVAASLAGEFNRRGPIQITLAPHTSGDRLAAQIRGELTQPDVPAPQQTPLQRQTKFLPPSPLESVQAALAVEDVSISQSDTPSIPLVADEAIIQRQREEFALNDALAPPDVPLTVDTLLPQDNVQENVVEADAMQHVAPAEPTPMDRATLAASQRSVTADLEVSLTPTSRDAANSDAHAQSIADAFRPRDAEPTLAAQRPVTHPDVVADFLVPAGIDLPLDPGEFAAPAPVSEPAVSRPAAVVVDSPRDQAPDALAPTPSVIESITPEGVAIAVDTTLVEESSVAAATDARPPVAIHIAEASPPSSLKVPLNLAHLLLPAMESANAPELTEDAPQLQPVYAESPRPDVAESSLSDVYESPEDAPVIPTTREVAVRPFVRRWIDAKDVAPVESPLGLPGAPSERIMPPAIATATIDLPHPETSTLTKFDEDQPRFQPLIDRASRAALVASPVVPDARTVPLTPAQRRRIVEQIVSAAAVTPLDHRRLPAAVDTPFVSLNVSPEPSPVDAMSLRLELPEEELIPDNPYVQRFADDDRRELLRRMGGSKKTERAVERALKWLAAHQSADGHWDAIRFDDGCGACDGQSDIKVNNALTGLSVLCFLGAGHTHTHPGPYYDNVRRALQWLVDNQADDGDLRGEETMYSHGIASIALSESYAMTGDSRLKDPVRRAVRFIDRARSEEESGWRYDPGIDGDTSVLGWQVMALKSARLAGIEVPQRSFETALKWLGRVTQRATPGLYSYQPGFAPTPSMTAEGMFSHLLLGLSPKHPRFEMSVDFILENLPDWDDKPNTYYWYYASLALFQHQGDAWKTWNRRLSKQLVKHQRRDGGAAGSWNPEGEWAALGGRVYQTALCTLMLEVYYRYLPLFSIDESAVFADPPEWDEVDAPEDAIGAIRGLVWDEVTGAALAGASIRLSLPGQTTVKAIADAQGNYVLLAPNVPEFFALSASLDGYVPATTNVERARLAGRIIDVGFSLKPIGEALLVTETDPDVHHLGDNRFDGAINSQFQKESEGTSYTTSFIVTDDQLPPRFKHAEVVLLARGVQRKHKIVINGTTLDVRLDEAPDDGSFGEFVAPFDASLLRVGENEIQIIARPSKTDVDDFEFVNIRVRLLP